MKYALIIMSVLLAGVAYAAITANPIVMGTQSIVGGHAVWTPISSSNPLPATLVIGP